MDLAVAELAVSVSVAHFVVSVSVAVLVSCFIYYLFRGKNKSVQLPPGSLGWPLIGETLQFLSCQKRGSPQEFFNERRSKYGDIFKTSLLGSPTIVLCNADGNRFVFSNENKVLAYSCPSPVCKLVGKSLVGCSGDKAMQVKKLLWASLKADSIRTYVGRVDLIVRNHLAKFWNGKLQVMAYSLIKKYTFTVACSLFASIDGEEEQQVLSDHFVVFMRGVLQLPLNFPGTRYYKAIKAGSSIRERIQRVIEQRRRDIAMGDSEARDVISSMLLAGADDGFPKGLEDEEIRDNILFLLMAGHETSCSTIAALLLCLARNPDCYHQILQEQKEIRESKNPDAILDWEDISKMKYAKRAVQEVLRLHPAAQGSFREAVRDTSYMGYTIPKGWKVYWTVNSTQKRAEHFSEPEDFRPSRFEGEGPSPYTFMPFGSGPRMCPGYEFAYMEILVFMYYILQNFQWELVDHDETIVVDPLPTVVKGLRLKLTFHGQSS